MNQYHQSDDFYSLVRFREKLSKATAASDQTGVVLDMPATVCGMAARHGMTKLAVQAIDGGAVLIVRSGRDTFFNVQMSPEGRAPILGLVRESAPA